MGSIMGFGTEYEMPEMSPEEQEAIDAMLEEAETQSQREDYLFNEQMRADKKRWEWDEGIDPETMEFAPDQKLVDDLELYQNKIDSYQDQIDEWKESPNSSGFYGDQIAEYAHQIKKWKKKIKSINSEISAAEEDWETPELGDLDYGSWVQMTDDEWLDDPTVSQSDKDDFILAQAQREKSLAALEGTLEFSPEMEEQRDIEFENLKQVYAIEGDNWLEATGSDTIATQNLQAFKEKWQRMENSVKHGEAGSSMQDVIMSKGLTTGQTQNRIGTLAAMGGGGSTFPMYASLLQPYQQYRMAGYQAQAANQANQMSMYGSLLGLGGMLGGAALMASSRDYKTGIKAKSKADEDKALESLTKTKSYEYRYKKKMGMGTDKKIGTMAEESPEEMVTPDGKAIDIGNKLELISMAVKALNRKVNHGA